MNPSNIIYLDNAASSWPKPMQVQTAMQEVISECTANPGRGGHQLAVRASRIILDARKNVSRLFNVKNPMDIFFALNTTMALNIAIQGFLKEGDHVICTSFEHNSVRRPLEHMKLQRNVQVSYIACQQDGKIELDELRLLIQSNTRLIVINHSSNLLGNIVPVTEVAEIARKNGAALLLDAAQTAGVIPIDVQNMGIDMLAFPGHKALFGPQGTGGLYIDPKLEVAPLIFGGTGSKSEELLHPDVRPDRYEAGTPNTVGIAGLNEGVQFVLKETVAQIHKKESEQIQWLMEELTRLGSLRLLGPSSSEPRTGLISFVHPRIDASEMAFILDQTFQIAVRAGYHCTPLAHQTAGTFEGGAVRASISYFTTNEELLSFVDAIKDIAKHYS